MKNYWGFFAAAAKAWKPLPGAAIRYFFVENSMLA